VKRKSSKPPEAAYKAVTWPKIRSRQTTKISPWMNIVAREVEFSADGPTHVYHAVGQADYVSILALLPDGRIPIVRQYRPAAEAFTWELPAGMVDPGEDAEVSCRRELMEETGYPARAIHRLGNSSPCTGRLSNRIHSFFVEAGERARKFEAEPGLTVKLVQPVELVRLIKSGEFISQLHIGTLMLAELHGFLVLPRKAAQKTGRPARRPRAK
jgi:8-oxo-dGTP pyrophosphatase MutT (NUDIX family)